MSYLNALRLHFSGRFQANVSTVNNDPAHFDNASFKPSYQAMEGAHMQPPNGWFNPQGDAAWRFLGCQVTSASTPDGPVGSTDPVLGYLVADSDRRAPAKLVDLDSEQQLVSEIWGLQVRIAKADGTTMLIADFEPAAFIDIWDRSTDSAGGDTIAGAMYQSVLRNLQWSDVSSSPFLTALQAASTDGVLSIKFNVDSFNMDFTSPDFMTGRIAGTIGPATLSEPQHMVLGRQFMANSNPYSLPPGNFFRPDSDINFCVGVVDAASRQFLVDLGNALPTGAGGSILDLGDLAVIAFDPLTGASYKIGTIPSKGAGGYTADPQWYARTAGVVTVPIPADKLQQAQTMPLSLVSAIARISESSTGAFLRADTYVYRLSPGDSVDIAVYATQWGQPLAGAGVTFSLDSSQLQPGSGFPYVAASPPVATPTSALVFNATATTGSDGIAHLKLTASDPGTPRWFNNGADYGIDGQVYGIRPQFTDAETYGGGAQNQWNFISFLVWSGFTPSNPVTWIDLQPIFQQYANLYPVMNRFLDLGNYASVQKNAGLLSLAFGLNPDDPNAMPVTRDLSPAKRDAILSWLAGDMPFGVPPLEPGPVIVQDAAPPAALSAVAATGKPAQQGGKAAAAARRLILQTK